jgi:tetratricopeptide (TPR) repeat protein
MQWERTKEPMADYYDLGNHSRGISTSSAEAQTWFDRGLIWTFGFNHEEAIKCFDRVLEHDPNCAMAHWGRAYALGPNYNKPWEAFDEVDLKQSLAGAHAAAQQSLALLEHTSPPEQALIRAIQSRYQSADPVENLARWNDDYADAMRDVYRQYPADLDIVALFAEALLNRTPWELWDLQTGGPAEGASTLEATSVLEDALETPEARTHPGILHMYIHLMEMSPHPERALRVCDWLRDLVPDSGHLQHMPTHIDVLCGHYREVITSNEAAIRADTKFLEREGAMNFYSLYRSHNYHFKLYGAMFLGQYEAAMDASKELLATIPEDLLRVESPPMADWLETFVPMGLHALVRFGKWQKIIDTPLPEDQELYSFTTALTHYAKGVAYSAVGNVADAERERDLFDEALERVPESRMLFNNTGRDILAVAREMLYGELEYRKGNYDVAFGHLRRSVELDDGLPYDEPWGWMQPTRHALGALLLEQDRVEEAAQVYREDLGFDPTLPRPYQHPENVWALHGYHECLLKLGRIDEAKIVRQRLDLAAARADVPIHASCYCRVSAVT